MDNKRVEKRSPAEVWLSVEQAADVLGLPRLTVRRWARDGDARMPAYRVWDEGDGRHGRFRFKKSEVEAFHELLKAQAPAPSSE